jgi:transcription antitermination factor NusG
MPGIRRIISAGDAPVAVTDDVVTLVRRRLETIDDVGYGNLRQGDPVRISSGPLRDLEAVFDRPLKASDRVRILLEVLGHLTPVDIDYSQITRI